MSALRDDRLEYDPECDSLGRLVDPTRRRHMQALLNGMWATQQFPVQWPFHKICSDDRGLRALLLGAGFNPEFADAAIQRIDAPVALAQELIMNPSITPSQHFLLIGTAVL